MKFSAEVSNGHILLSSPKFRRKRCSVYDWSGDRQAASVFDDGTVTFFWRAHTLTVLFLLTCYLIYVAIFETVNHDPDYNLKRGIIAVVLIFLLLGVTQTEDGPFKRPHPALWRFVYCTSIVYELGLIFLLFQTVDDARQFLVNFDENLGKPLPEKDYGGNCLIYDPDSLNHFHNLIDKIDIFVVIHFFGHFFKTLILRDFWLCQVISIVFELCEYSLEHQLPNFSECWWDHWLLDVAICNNAGIFAGMKLCKFLSLKHYNWRGLWTIPSLKGKVKRVAQQFTPYSWMEFDWKPMDNVKRWIAVVVLTSLFLLAELNAFYLKFVLWLPAPHFLNFLRIMLALFVSAAGMRECFQFMDDTETKRLGKQAWIAIATVITEFLVCVKFGWPVVTIPPSKTICVFWLLVLFLLIVHVLWTFFARPYLWPADFAELCDSESEFGFHVDGKVEKDFNQNEIHLSDLNKVKRRNHKRK